MTVFDGSRLLFERAMREDRGRFAAVRDARVFVYWPHGLGDWTHLAAIAPLLEPSNAYAIARFGDDYSALLEGHPQLRPLRSGVRAPGDGAEGGARHLGFEPAPSQGRPREGPAARAARRRSARLRAERAAVDGLSGDRGAHRLSVSHQSAQSRALAGAPRTAGIVRSRASAYEHDRFRRVRANSSQTRRRLGAFAPPGTRLCVLSRAGVTAARKNWGDGSEARAFVANLAPRGSALAGHFDGG